MADASRHGGVGLLTGVGCTVAVAVMVANPVYGVALVAAAAMVAAVTLVPFVAFVGMAFMLTGWPYYAGIPVGRDIPLPVVLPLVLVMAAVVALRMAFGVGSARTTPAMRRVDWAVAGLAGVILLTILLHGVPPDSLKSFFRAVLMPGTIYVICRHFMRDGRSTRITLDATLAGSAIAGLYGVLEWVMGYSPLMETFAPATGSLALDGYWAASSGAYGSLYRSFGFGMNPIFYGGSLAIMLTYATMRGITAESRRIRWTYAGLAFCCLAGVLSALSRGPVVALGAGLVLLAVAYKQLRIFVVLGFLGVAGIASYAAMQTSGVVASRVNDYDNVTLRLKLWQIAWHMFLDHPLSGVGFSAFPSNQLTVVRDHQIGPFYEFGGKLEELKTAEEAFLQFGAETGLLGYAAAGVLALALLRVYLPALLRQGRREPERGLVVFAGTGVVVFLAVGLTVTVYNAWEAACLVPLMLASLVNGDAPATPPERAPAATPPGN